MSELDDATKRLDQAVQRLEAASKRLGDVKPGSKNAAVVAETTAMVAAKLEEAILRIDRLLEE
ncbi:MAG TPA: hypothetical protein VN728_00670 [Stellaceae bacterium]|jgi:hypothetical protein|nr:hypothetical protein [Stellaceae bacterium]